MYYAGMIPMVLYLVCLVLPLPCALLAALVLGLRKGSVHKGLWAAVCILSVLCALGMVLIEGIAAYQSAGGFLTPMPMVRSALVSLVCFVPALIFPLTLNGRRDGLKALLLVPAILSCIFSLFKFRMVGFVPMLMVYLPLLVVLLLAVVWALSGRKTALGILLALCAAGCLLTLPILCAMAGFSLQYMQFNPLRVLDNLQQVFSMLFSAPFKLIQQIRISGLALPAYALLALLTTAGLLSAKLPGKAESAKPAPQPVQAAQARRFCVHCGAAVEPGMKFCGKCGKPIQ